MNIGEVRIAEDSDFALLKVSRLAILKIKLELELELELESNSTHEP
jgi:hypothetical protein